VSIVVLIAPELGELHLNLAVGKPQPRLRISIDQDRLEFFGVEQRDVYDTIQALFGGTTVGYSHRGEGRNPIEIVDGRSLTLF
jgi:multidrug efflux pump subunit AcrB